MDKVKALIAAGASIATAIKEGLGMDVTAFAEQYSVPASNISAGINGRRSLSDREIDALHACLGGSREELVGVLADAMRRQATALSA